MTKPEISLDEIKRHCRIELGFNDDDTLLQGFAAAALEVCQTHIGKRFDSDLEFNAAIKVGCLMYIGLLNDNREMVSDAELKEVPFSIACLWNVYREPGVY